MRQMTHGTLRVRRANSAADRDAALRLRYEVFAGELGADGPSVDHQRRRETDDFDVYASHLLLEDLSRPLSDRVVGTYRMLSTQQAAMAGGFYSQDEYDLAPLLATGRPVVELGRSCLHPAYRGGTALFTMWQGLAAEVETSGAELLFGVASFHGTDRKALAQPLSLLHHKYIAPPALRVRARHDPSDAEKILPPDQIDQRAAMAAMPALIKSYLRLGAVVGEGAFVDHGFNTTDVCLILDLQSMSARQRALYQNGLAA